jgi:hypothetical protein
MVKKHIETIILPCFCLTSENIDPEKKSKMDRLIDIWDKTKYFPPPIIEVSLFYLNKIKLFNY